jgi:hypothetical protein
MSKEKICTCSDGCTWSAIEYVLLQQIVFIYLVIVLDEILIVNYFQFVDLEGI